MNIWLYAKIKLSSFHFKRIEAFKIRIQAFKIRIQALKIRIQALKIRIQALKIWIQAFKIRIQAFKLRIQAKCVIMNKLGLVLTLSDGKFVMVTFKGSSTAITLKKLTKRKKIRLILYLVSWRHKTGVLKRWFVNVILFGDYNFIDL